MRPKVKTLTAVGSSGWIPVDQNKKPFSIGIGVKITGTINVTVEHTFDDPFNAAAVLAGLTAFSHPTLVAITASADGNYAHPVRAVRLTVNSVSGGTAVATFIQAG